MTENEILSIVNKFKTSDKYNKMIIGENYFKSKTDILKRQFYYFPNAVKALDPYRANNKIVDNFFRMLIEQKVSYCLAKDVVINGYVPSFDINDFIDIVAEESSIKGIGWGHPYIDDLKRLVVGYIPSEQIIPQYDNTIEKKLISIIRFYEINEELYIEFWDNKKIIYYKSYENTIIVTGENVNQWGKVPFVPLYNNRFEISDLDNIKELIDTFDKTISDFSNNFEDMQDVYYKIKNYAGSTANSEDIAIIIESLKQHKIIPVDENGDFEAVQLELPYLARETYLKLVKQLIFLFGQGVDTDDLSGGSLTNVVIQAKFSHLEQKCNKFLKFVKRFIEELLYFDIKFKTNNGNPDTTIDKLQIIFNKTTLINETENIDNVETSNGLITRKTNISNHPWVDDIDKELKEMDEEEIDYNESLVGEEGDFIDTSGTKKPIE